MYEKTDPNAIMYPDEQGGAWGDYQLVDHDHDLMMAQPAGVGQELEALDISPYVATEEQQGLTYIRSDMRKTLKELVERTTKPVGIAQAQGGYLVEAVPSEATLWIEDRVIEGYAVLVALDQVEQGRPIFFVTNMPLAIVGAAGPYKQDAAGQPIGNMAILAGPAPLLGAAHQLLVQPEPTPDPGTPFSDPVEPPPPPPETPTQATVWYEQPWVVPAAVASAAVLAFFAVTKK